ncbi:MAG: hypothetical protein FJX18_07050, partial [Alphaproteobacteria bacterium]|nr:hypothetical protein [Alphaproteobacteria bacterium]
MKAGIAGGTAAMVSEMLGEGLIGSPEELQRNPIDPESVKGQLFFAKAIGAIAGSLICEGADPTIAMRTAQNALDNNYLQMILRANGRVEFKRIDDPSRPDDDVRLIIEDPETGQTKAVWVPRKKDDALSPVWEGAKKTYQWMGSKYSYIQDAVVNNEWARNTRIKGATTLKAVMVGTFYDGVKSQDEICDLMTSIRKGPPIMVSDGLGFFLPPTLAEAAFVYGSGFVVGKGVSGCRYLRGGVTTHTAESVVVRVAEGETAKFNVKWVDEPSTMSAHARKYNDSASG